MAARRVQKGLERARQVLLRLGFQATSAEGRARDGELAPDWFAKLGGERYAVVVKAVGPSLSLSHLGEPVLRLVALTAGSDLLKPLLVVLVERILSDKALERFQQRLQAHRVDQVSWLVVAGNGEAKGRLGGRLVHLKRDSDAERSVPNDRGPSRVSFSDNEQWLLKLLLLGQGPDSWWSTESAGCRAPKNANLLAAVGDVSTATAYRLVRSLAATGYATRRWGETRVEHPEALLEEWTGRYRLTDNTVFPFAPDPYALPADWRPEVLRRLRVRVEAGAGGTARAEADAEAECALTAYAACEHMKLQHTRATIALHVYVAGDPTAFAQRLGLVPEPTARGRDLVYLIRPACPRSVFRGAAVHDGVRIVDPLQCYLDLFHNHDAGREQARYLFDFLLRERLEAVLNA